MGVDRRHRIDGEFKIHEKIGNGAFGEVYRVVSRSSRQRAAKFVSRDYRYLLDRENEVMLPIPSSGSRLYGSIYKYFYGQHGDRQVLVMDLLGQSLSDLSYTYHLSRKTVLMLGIQMTRRLKELHDRGYVHRDLKPDNFLVGRSLPDSKYVYLIDYGFAESYKDASNRHKSKSFGHSFVGTNTFAPKHAHRGERQSRRSDLESLVYSLIYIIRGTLPWEHLSESRTKSMKECISAGELCHGVPDAILEYYRNVRALSFSDRPDYGELMGYLESGLNLYGYSLDYRFEWT